MAAIRRLARELVTGAAVAMFVYHAAWLLRKPKDVRHLRPDEVAAISEAPGARLVFEGAHRDTLTVFLSYRCPYCAGLYSDIVRPDAPRAVIVRHVALNASTIEAQAAVAAECARRYDRFHSYSYALFAKRDSVGSLPWVSFAVQAGIRDTSGFMRCVESRLPLPVVLDDISLARRLGVPGTPALAWRRRLVIGPVRVAALLSELEEGLRRGPADVTR